MKSGVIAAAGSLLLACTLTAQTAVDQVSADAIAIERVAAVSERDLPVKLLKRMVNEDIELLRGRRPDGTYQYASLERFEGSRISESFSVQPRSDRMETFAMRGEDVYRVVVGVPSRRMLLRKNRPVWLERVDVEYIPDGSKQTRVETFDVKAWLQPEDVRTVELPAIARQANVKVIATADPKGGYGNIDVALVQARIVDKADSPYAAAVAGARALLRAIDDENAAAVRAAARRMGEGVGGRMSVIPAERVEQSVASVPDTAARAELQSELQAIEDLLTGSESERRLGMDRLHQLIRRLR